MNLRILKVERQNRLTERQHEALDAIRVEHRRNKWTPIDAKPCNPLQTDEILRGSYRQTDEEVRQTS